MSSKKTSTTHNSTYRILRHAFLITLLENKKEKDLIIDPASSASDDESTSSSGSDTDVDTSRSTKNDKPKKAQRDDDSHLPLLMLQKLKKQEKGCDLCINGDVDKKKHTDKKCEKRRKAILQVLESNVRQEKQRKNEDDKEKKRKRLESKDKDDEDEEEEQASKKTKKRQEEKHEKIKNDEKSNKKKNKKKEKSETSQVAPPSPSPSSSPSTSATPSDEESDLTLEKFQPVRRGRYFDVVFRKEDNMQFYTTLESARMFTGGHKKAIYLSWFESGNCLPDSCIVVIPRRTNDVAMFINSSEKRKGEDGPCCDPKDGWVEINADRNGEIEFPLKFETVQSLKMVTPKHSRNIVNVTAIFDVYNKSINFSKEYDALAFPPLTYTQRPEDITSITKIGTLCVSVEIKTTERQTKAIYGYTQTIKQKQQEEKEQKALLL